MIVNRHNINISPNRFDGPSFIGRVGKGWLRNNTLHRNDGPASIRKDDYPSGWYINGFPLFLGDGIPPHDIDLRDLSEVEILIVNSLIGSE